MAAYVCRKCEIMIVSAPAEGNKVKCPSCEGIMLPRSGPGAVDINFPDKADRETVLNFPAPEEIKELQNRQLKEQEKRLDALKQMDDKKKPKKK